MNSHQQQLTLSVTVSIKMLILRWCSLSPPVGLLQTASQALQIPHQFGFYTRMLQILFDFKRKIKSKKEPMTLTLVNNASVCTMMPACNELIIDVFYYSCVYGPASACAMRSILKTRKRHAPGIRH
jgi:hypothetical protein